MTSGRNRVRGPMRRSGATKPSIGHDCRKSSERNEAEGDAGRGAVESRDAGRTGLGKSNRRQPRARELCTVAPKTGAHREASRYRHMRSIDRDILARSTRRAAIAYQTVRVGMTRLLCFYLQPLSAPRLRAKAKSPSVGVSAFSDQAESRNASLQHTGAFR